MNLLETQHHLHTKAKNATTTTKNLSKWYCLTKNIIEYGAWLIWRHRTWWMLLVNYFHNKFFVRRSSIIFEWTVCCVLCVGWMWWYASLMALHTHSDVNKKYVQTALTISCVTLSVIASFVRLLSTSSGIQRAQKFLYRKFTIDSPKYLCCEQQLTSFARFLFFEKRKKFFRALSKIYFGELPLLQCIAFLMGSSSHPFQYKKLYVLNYIGTGLKKQLICVRSTDRSKKILIRVVLCRCVLFRLMRESYSGVYTVQLWRSRHGSVVCMCAHITRKKTTTRSVFAHKRIQYLLFERNAIWMEQIGVACHSCGVLSA